MTGTILAIVGLVVGCTFVVLIGFWIYRRVTGPPPPREPTSLDLDKIEWDLPTIFATLCAALATIGGVFVMLQAGAFQSVHQRLWFALMFGVSIAIFFGTRKLLRTIGLPPSDEN